MTKRLFLHQNIASGNLYVSSSNVGGAIGEIVPVGALDQTRRAIVAIVSKGWNPTVLRGLRDSDPDIKAIFEEAE